MGNASVKEIGKNAASIITKPVPKLPSSSAQLDTATFAAGCFWGVELSFQRVPGVVETAVGYIDGHKQKPTYEEVCTGRTGHTEAVQMKFDPSLVSYSELLTVLWDRMDPTTLNRQGNDFGSQYRSGIYCHSEWQMAEAVASCKAEQARRTLPIVTEIKMASRFWPAEDYHQQYLEKGGQCARKGDTTAISCYG
ncbi:unnamed protein product [Phaeothamnion confervicola]